MDVIWTAPQSWRRSATDISELGLAARWFASFTYGRHKQRKLASRTGVVSKGGVLFVLLLERRETRFFPGLVLNLTQSQAWQTHEDDVTSRGHQYRRQHNQGEIDDIEVFVVDAFD